MDKIKTTLKVSIPDRDGLTIPLVFKQDAAHKVWVNWGDGSYPETYSYQGLIEASHKYSASGDYIITMEAVDEGYIILGGGYTGGNAIGGSDEAAARMLVEVCVGTDVTGISDYAFRNCENLEKVTFPKTQELSIGAYAFEGCMSLEEIAIPKNISTIERGTFANCSSLRTVYLPSGIYEIESNAFNNCGQLRSINLLGVTNIGKYAFANCRMLREIKLGESCRNIGQGAFQECSCARTIILGHAINIEEDAFYNAKSICELTIPASVDHLGERAFGGCTSLRKIKMEATEPPTLASIRSIEANEGLKITVPIGSEDAYRRDTNWAAFSYAI